MTYRKLVSGFLLLAVLGGKTAVLAHHGVGPIFDLESELTISGRVTDFRLVNPHGFVYLDVINARGEVEAWTCEMSGGSLLRRSGWSEDMLPVGTEIRIYGHPARRDDQGCYVEEITLSDGQVLINDDRLRAPVTDLTMEFADGIPNLNGNWVHLRGPRPTGSGPQFSQSEAGIAASAGFDPQDNPRLNCKSTNIIWAWYFNEAVNTIVQTDESITLNYGYMDMISRTIHLDMNTHPANLVPSFTGHSIGKWEGDTLVVDTIGFAEGYLLANNSGVRHSEAMHLIERFSLSEDGHTLNRTYVINDPLFLTEPYEGNDALARTAFPFEDYDCEDLTQ